MRERAQNRLAHASEEFAEAWIARGVAAKNQRVYESANKIFGFEHRAARNGGPDDDVFLLRIAIQQGLKSGEQSHEQRRTFALAQVLERVAKLLGQLSRDPRAFHISG